MIHHRGVAGEVRTQRCEEGEKTTVWKGEGNCLGSRRAGTGVASQGTTLDIEKAGVQRISIVRKEKNFFPGI